MMTRAARRRLAFNATDAPTPHQKPLKTSLLYLSLGLFLWVINAAMLALVASFLDGFAVAGFGSALLGALVVSFTGWVANAYIGDGGRYEVIVARDQRG